MKDLKNVKAISSTAKNLPHYKAAYNASSHSSGSIKPIDKSDYTKSNNNFSSSQQVQLVYERLKAMADEYRSFFRYEQEFEKAFAEVDPEEQDFLKNLIEFLSLYNASIETLIEFDKYFNTLYTKRIVDLVLVYEESLHTIFVNIEPDGKFRFIIKKMVQHYKEKSSDFEFLIGPNGLGQQLLDKFRSVKSIVLDNSDDRMLVDEIHGLIIDKKC